MDRRMRAFKACLALLAVTFGGLALSSQARAATTDLDNWNLSEGLTQWGPPTQFHVSSGGSAVQFRWLDTPNKVTVISANNCIDWSTLGASSTFGVNDTSYHTLHNGYSGQCFILRGRTAAGQGSMTNHDGRVSR